MNILVIESDFYLAKSICSRLEDMGFVCEMSINLNLVRYKNDIDLVLFATNNAAAQDIKEFVKADIGVILLVDYISANTTFDFIEAGADDYIQKPVIISELARKIRTTIEHKRTRRTKEGFEALLMRGFEKAQIPEFDYRKVQIPLLVLAESREYCDNFVYNYIKTHNLRCIDIGSNNKNIRKIINSLDDHALLYVTNFCNEPVSDFTFLKLINEPFKLILGSNHNLEAVKFPRLKLAPKNVEFGYEKFLSIDEYIRATISVFQNSMSDTELAKTLGISRKSLWAKRKKYALSKER